MNNTNTVKHILDLGMLLQDNTISKEHRKQLASIVRDMGKDLTLAEITDTGICKILGQADTIVATK